MDAIKTVLIVDNQPNMRLLLSRTLSRLNDLTILQAVNGEEAWGMFRQHHPDLVLLEAQMPGRTGLNLTQSIRREPEFGHLPIILIADGLASSVIVAGLAAGANEYVVKPFSPVWLRQRVEQLLAM